MGGWSVGREILESNRKKTSHGAVTATQREERWSGGAFGWVPGGGVISDGARAEPPEAEPAEEQQAAG